MTKPFELVDRTGHVGLAGDDVHLHGLGALHVGGVGDGGGDGCGVRTGILRMHVRDLERGIAQAVAERVVDGLAVGVVIAVADEHTLAVVDVTLLAGPVDHARVVLDVQRNGLGELAGRADLAEDHVGERGTAGLAEQPGFEDALGMAGPRGDGDDGAVGQHDGDVRVDGGDLGEQFELLGGHVEGSAIEAFGLGGLGKPEEQERHVGIPGGFDGFELERGIGGIEVEGEPGAKSALMPRSASVSRNEVILVG